MAVLALTAGFRRILPDAKGQVLRPVKTNNQTENYIALENVAKPELATIEDAVHRADITGD